MTEFSENDFKELQKKIDDEFTSSEIHIMMEDIIKVLSENYKNIPEEKREETAWTILFKVAWSLGAIDTAEAKGQVVSIEEWKYCFEKTEQFLDIAHQKVKLMLELFSKKQ